MLHFSPVRVCVASELTTSDGPIRLVMNTSDGLDASMSVDDDILTTGTTQSSVIVLKTHFE